MDLTLLLPLFCYAIASLVTIWSLKLRKSYRIIALGPICLFSFLSLVTAHNLSWPIGANSTFASVVVFYIPYSVKLLALDEHPVNPELSSHNWSFIDCYRIWNNPRDLPVRLGPLDRSAPCNPRSRAVFAANQALKGMVLVAFDVLIFRRAFIYALNHIVPADFAPAMELPPLKSVLHLSAHQIQVRAIVSVQWIWSAYYLLEGSHCMLSIVFVVVGFDRPKEWPALYGSPLDATSIRGFWGRFWHRLPISTYTHYAQLISRKLLGLQPSSRKEKTLIPLLIFAMSGLSHCLVGWALGDAALSRDILFFILNFFAAAAETTISKMRQSTPKNRMRSSRQRLAGLAWVFAFFFCATPVWIYPKVYHALMEAVQ